MTKEDMIADLKKAALDLYSQGKDKQAQDLMDKARKIEGANNDSLVCESCQ